ncbi:unnamed protein product [Polarella glacialis]|uniref:Uncharacterized protein n=1 Tax=Polarella glacialis TaxID=89957 RepID=A0A813J413_POLGL|nr:unnamed protein product [Polarella glacialis]
MLWDNKQCCHRFTGCFKSWSKTWNIGDRSILSGNPVGAAKKSDVSPRCGVGASSGSSPEGSNNVACCCCWDCAVASSAFRNVPARTPFEQGRRGDLETPNF